MWLPTYEVEVKRSNPGSLFVLSFKPNPGSNPVFKRLFFSFEGMKRGFLDGCRPFIGIDGCHLKGAKCGILLAVVALDANNGIFPLAVEVVESENKDSWDFFLSNPKTVIVVMANKPISIMSDGQKGLDTSVMQLFPHATHRICARHLCNNLKTAHPGLLVRKYFWQASRAYNEVQFKKAMDR